MDKPSTPSRSMILSATCRITDLLTPPTPWPVAAAVESIPTASASGTVGCFDISGSTSLHALSLLLHHMLTGSVNNVD